MLHLHSCIHLHAGRWLQLKCERLKQVTGAKNKLANQMDNLSVSDKHYDKKYEDMQVRLDELYDEIEEIETSIEAVETRLYNIKQEKISGDNMKGSDISAAYCYMR